MAKGKNQIEKDKRLLAMLILFFPTIIVIGLGGIENTVLRMSLQLLVAIYQIVIIRNFLDDYYGN